MNSFAGVSSAKAVKADCNNAGGMTAPCGKFTLNGQTPSKKNSKQVFFKQGRKIVISSKIYLAWEKTAKIEALEWKKNNHKDYKYPIKLHLYFYRNSKRKWDYNNISQGVQDVLVEVGILEDDDAYHCIPVFDGFEIDKDNPRVEGWIEESLE